MSIPIDTIVEIMKIEILKQEAKQREIPRFSKAYRYSWGYLETEMKKGKFNPDSSYGKRMLRNAIEHPNWTLEDWRGHGKPTGNIFKYSDERGIVPEGIQLKNRQEESKYGSYLNAVRKYQETGDDSELKKFKGKTLFDKNGSKQKLITDKGTLNQLAKFNELPSGEDIYIS